MDTNNNLLIKLNKCSSYSIVLLWPEELNAQEHDMLNNLRQWYLYIYISVADIVENILSLPPFQKNELDLTVYANIFFFL